MYAVPAKKNRRVQVLIGHGIDLGAVGYRAPFHRLCQAPTEHRGLLSGLSVIVPAVYECFC
jgi:hypothetical protein